MSAVGIVSGEGRIDEVIKVRGARCTHLDLLALTSKWSWGRLECCGYQGLISLPDRLGGQPAHVPPTCKPAGGWRKAVAVGTCSPCRYSSGPDSSSNR